MTVEDMSSYSPGLRVIVFSSTVEGLPQVKAIGDVIRFHRAVVSSSNSLFTWLVYVLRWVLEFHFCSDIFEERCFLYLYALTYMHTIC